MFFHPSMQTLAMMVFGVNMFRRENICIGTKHAGGCIKISIGSSSLDVLDDFLILDVAWDFS